MPSRFLSILFLSCLFLQNCFEYEETIFFRKPNSGTLEISYIVPLKKDSQESLIQFLPTQELDVQKRIKKKVNLGFVLRDFSFRELDKSEILDSPFKRKGKVSYKVDFEDVSTLETLLLGNSSVKVKQKSVSIKRDFPGFASKILESSSSGEKKIVSESLRLLKDGKLQFRVYFPKDSECSSNKGFVGLGMLQYGFSATETMDANSIEGKNWETKIRFF